MLTTIKNVDTKGQSPFINATAFFFQYVMKHVRPLYTSNMAHGIINQQAGILQHTYVHYG